MTAEQEAIALKEKGNKAFKEHDWPTAVEFYTQAIELNNRDVSFFTNRAQVLPATDAREHTKLTCARRTLN
jgi:serine/threonine-protein phosphatase 5